MYYAKSNQTGDFTRLFEAVAQVEDYIVEKHEGAFIEWDCYEYGREATLVTFPCIHAGCDSTVNWPDMYCWRCGY